MIMNYDDYEMFGHTHLMTMHPNGLPIPSYVQFDPERDSKYKPSGLTATLNGGIFVRDSRKLNLGMKVMGWLEKHIGLMIIVALGMIAIVMASYMQFPKW